VRLRHLAHELGDLRDRVEVRRGHLPVEDLKIELGFDGEHEIDDVERGEPARAQIIIVPDGPVDRALGEEATHQGGYACGRVVLRAIEQR